MESPTILTSEYGSGALPADLWEVVISKLVDPFDTFPYVYDEAEDYPPDAPLKPLSLVSKTFLSVTNRLKQTLCICSKITLDSCRVLFARFPNVVRLHILGSERDSILSELTRFQLPLKVLVLTSLDRFPRDILLSGLPMVTRSTLQALALMDILHLTEDDMGAIGDLFPNLVELNVTNPWQPAETCVNDEGIIRLASKIPGLRRINLKCNKVVTEKSVIYVFENCPDIQDVNVLGCPRVPHHVKKWAKRPPWGDIQWMVVDCDGCGL